MFQVWKIGQWFAGLRNPHYPVNAAMDFCKKYSETSYTAETSAEFIKDYNGLMVSVLRVFGLSKRYALDAIENIAYGNWERFWETGEDKQKSGIDFMKDIQCEIFYCSDRWTWDRIIRVNWMYLRLVSRVQKDIKN